MDSNVNIPTITKAEKPLEPSTTSSRATQTDLSHVHQVIPIILKITSPPSCFGTPYTLIDQVAFSSSVFIRESSQEISINWSPTGATTSEKVSCGNIQFLCSAAQFIEVDESDSSDVRLILRA